MFELIIGASDWLAMSGAQRRLLDEACRRSLDRAVTGFAAARSDVETRLRSTRGLAVRPFTGPVIEALRNASREAIAEEAGRDNAFAEVIASYNRFAPAR
jgi:TRAP-type mannitol/chloroaromatic compound transport system substrate-binding protein